MIQKNPSINKNIMQELIEKLKSKFNLSDEQSHEVLKTVANYVKEKFPMAAGVLDDLFKTGDKPSDKTGNIKTDEHTTDTDVAQALAGGAVPPGDLPADPGDIAKGFFEGNKKDY